MPKRIFAATGILTVTILVGIFFFLFVTGIGTFEKVGLSEFLLGTIWNPGSYEKPSWGILGLFMSTLMVSGLALCIALPLGLAIALYLSEIASQRMREILKPTIEMIAGIPSVVLGLLGLLFVAPFIAKIFHLSGGINIATAAILVAVSTLPTITSIAEDALSGVPKNFREASLALGASPWETIRDVTIPAAASGLIAASMLGLGRVIGETMIVLMVAGNSLAFPTSFFDPGRPMTAAIAIEIKEVVVGSLHWKSLFAIGLILFCITFALNFLADSLIRRTMIYEKER